MIAYKELHDAAVTEELCQSELDAIKTLEDKIDHVLKSMLRLKFSTKLSDHLGYVENPY